ncbi:hypothetical protein EDC01DRAFT_629666 [Geopyxis carbonaria]|nr:hypothetical protein EDC01DRAFT_629666 [Geopyxis carbonaria]
MQAHNIMTVAIPDVRRTHTGVSSPRSISNSDCAGYSCAYPSWPNRPCLSSEGSSSSLRMPDTKFVERLRGRALPEESIIDDDDDAKDSDFSSSSFSTLSTASTSTSNSTTSAAAIMKCSNSLLSRALHKATNACVTSPAIELHTS